MYKFKALVIDDETQIEAYFNAARKHLKDLKEIDITFDIINNHKQYNPNKPYDLLLVDYDLKKGYSTDILTGDEFIRQFRERNEISKVIFYSSSFIYQPTERKFDIGFKGKEVFDLINKLSVDRIVDKNNFDMMIEMIKECCERTDLIPIVLSKLLDEYEKDNIGMSYLDSQGNEIDAKSLLNEILTDSEEGKKFKVSIIDTLFSSLFSFKY